MNTKKILLVDDEVSLRQLISNSLKHAGYEVMLAQSGKEGLQKAFTTPPDLVLSDIMMPEMDGYEFVRRLRKAGIDSYIIFLTAKGSSADLLRGFDVEGDDYLIKPFQMPELLARIQAGLRLKEVQQKLAESNQKLSAALEQRDYLISMIAHDLRNPLHVLNSYASIIGTDVMTPNEIQEVFARRSSEMLRLIDKVAEMGNVEKHKIEFRIHKISLSSLVKERLHVFRPLANQSETELQSDVPPEVMIISDNKRISEIIDSMLLAALQLAGEGSKISCQLIAEEDQTTEFRVSFPNRLRDVDVANVLDSVELGKNWKDGMNTSAHLGLVISKRLMQLLGGTFDIVRLPDNHLGISMVLPNPTNDNQESACERIKLRGACICENS